MVQTPILVSDAPGIPALALGNVLELFLDDRAAQGLSQQTVTWYRHRLTPMLTWIQERLGVNTVPDVKTAHLQSYIDHRTAEGCLRRDGSGEPFDPKQPLSPKSQRDYATAARAMWNFLVEQEQADENPALRLRKVKQVRKVIEAFSDDEQRRLLQEPPASFAGKRDNAALTLMLGTGIRLGEMLGLRLTDIDLPAHKFRVMGKGAKERELPLSPRVESTLRRWLKFRQKDMDELAKRIGSVSDFVFPTESGQPLQARDFQKRMAKYGERARIRVRCSPHTCRHTFALSFVRNGGEAFRLQVLLGHSDLTMTRRYCDLGCADAFDQGRAFNPIELLGLGDAPAARVPRKLRDF